MGVLLVILGLVPGLPHKCAKALAEAAASLSFRFPGPVRVPVPFQQAELPPLGRNPWLTALGMALISLALYAYISR
jgi:hypothetical protein